VFVCRSVCNVRSLAKRCVLRKDCLNKQIGLPDRYLWYQFGPTTSPYFLQTAILTATSNTFLANFNETASVSATNSHRILLTAYSNWPSPYPTVPSSISCGHSPVL